MKSGVKMNGIGHAHRYDTDAEFRYQCNLGGVPRRLICELFGADGRTMTKLEAVEREYLLANPAPAAPDPSEQYPNFIVR